MEDITLKWKLKNGMQSIYNGIAGDLTGEIRLETPVVKIDHHDNGATVTTEAGEVIEADAVICTAPVGALDNIEFTPQLSETIRKVVNDMNAEGAKIWIKVRNRGFEVPRIRTKALQDLGSTF